MTATNATHPDSLPPAARTAALVGLILVAIVWLVNGVYLSALSHVSLGAFWLADFTQWILLPSVILVFLAARHRIGPTQYGLALPPLLRISTLLWTGVAFATLHPAFFQVRDIAWQLLGKPTGFFAIEAAFPDGALGTAIWMYSSLTAGLVESVFFIGIPWLLWEAYGRRSRAWFVVLVSLLFAWAHWEQGLHVVAGAFAFNVVACCWYLGLRTLWPVVIGHTIADLIALG